MPFRKTMTAIALAASVALLAACDSAEERAEKHYKTGMEYLASGDVDRALVEFRNVFKLDGSHKEARRAYAEAERGRGNLREAFSQYLRLVEQYPDDVEAKRELALVAAQAGDWATAAEYATATLAVSPDDSAVEAVKIAAEYADAAGDNDPARLVTAAAAARALLEKAPDELMLHRVVIDDLIRAQRFDDALAAINAAITIAPTDRALYTQRLSIYGALGNNAAVEENLIDMVDRFADAPELGNALVRWYISQHQIDKAEAFLRSQITPDSTESEPELNLVRFLAEQRGREAAMAELDRAVAAGNSSIVFRAARAGFAFDLGRKDEAIAEMEEIAKTAEPSEDSRRVKVGLAQMLSATGNLVGARKLIEEVLEEDAGDNDALKLKARWLILDDQVGDAIAILRRANDQNPRDAEVLTLMAEAYERDGNRELMRESLQRAVETSNSAPTESLRYAQFLVADDKLIPAEDVLIDALRMAPGSVQLLVPLGQLYIQMQDWPRAEAVSAELEAQDDSAAKLAAQGLRAGILSGQQKTDEAIGYLRDLVSSGKGGTDVKLAALRAQLASGQIDQARAYAAELLAETPDDPNLQFIEASVRGMAGDTAGAEAAYRKILADDDKRQQVWMALARVVLADPGRTDEGAAVIDDGLKALPDSAELKWAKAGLLEKKGDIDGAIAIYDDLYKQNSANPVIANNLASLLSSYRKDPESLARAEIIARRLRGSPVPAYQDTYGWIAYQRGNYQDAATELEKAAPALAEDPSVQYHLGMTYLALQRKTEAMAQFEKVEELGVEGDTREVIGLAREELARLKAEGIAPSD